MIITKDPRILQDEKYTWLDMHHHSTASDGDKSAEYLSEKFSHPRFGICLADHNAIKGSVYLAKQDKLTIPAIEITTKTAKDILAYFYDVRDLIGFYEDGIKNSIRNNVGFNLNRTLLGVQETIDKIKAHNGIAVLAHPYGWLAKKAVRVLDNQELMRQIDGTEIYNMGHATKKQVEKITSYGKPIFAGTDNHRVSQMNALTGCKATDIEEFLKCILKQKNIIYQQDLSLLKRFYNNWVVFRNNVRINPNART